jgi:hypothetical protein
VKNDVVCAAQKVEYRDSYPLLNLDAKDDDENLLPLLTKSDVWQYEDEYRLVAQEQAQAVPAATLICRNNLLRLPGGALEAVIVGCNARPDTVKTLREMVKKHAPGLTTKRAVRVRNHYALIVCDV